MDSQPYRVCARCIMDTSDPDITFDRDGVCNHCLKFDVESREAWHPNEHGRQHLEDIITRIKRENIKKAYDCIIGLSGGLDSSYLAYLARREFDLRLLAVHIDGGWNSELAVKNIESIVTRLDIDLYTEVVDWEEMRDLQRAFLRASLSNQDVPQDHAFISGLYRQAVRHRIRYVLSGGNMATESILPSAWAYNAMDLRHVMGVHRRFGERPLRSFPRVSFFEYYFWYPVVKRMTVVRPLDFVPYDRDQAIRTLAREVGFRYYGGKHFESRFTKWQQLRYRPRKFGFDSRRAHLSSLVASGQMSRQAALEQMSKYEADDADSDEDTEYVRKKLGFSAEEFEHILNCAPRTFKDYPSNYFLFELKEKMKRSLGALGFRPKSRS